jgi:hypothetical protein
VGRLCGKGREGGGQARYDSFLREICTFVASPKIRKIQEDSQCRQHPAAAPRIPPRVTLLLPSNQEPHPMRPRRRYMIARAAQQERIVAAQRNT